MCFSATASFTASAVLTVVGIATITQIKSKRSIMLGLIPSLFAIQQFSEGFVWLSMNTVAAYVFLLFAYIILPLWAMCTLFILETHQIRKKILATFIGLGLLYAIVASALLLTQTLDISVVDCSLSYDFNFAGNPGKNIALILYTFLAVTPIFVSSNRWFWLFGSSLLVALVFTYIFKYIALISVWCFFAAMLSMLLLYIIRKSNS